MSRLGTLGANLYNGKVAYDFVGKRKLWYGVSGVLVVISILALLVLRLHLGVEFKGGAVFTVNNTTGSVEQARDTVADAGVDGAVVTKINNDRLRITTPPISTEESEKVQTALAEEFDTTVAKIDVQLVGPTWGEQITKKAFTGLIVFLVLVAIVLSLYFEWKMAIAALIALIHDLIITVGLYALVGFEVTPATVIGILTILGYSLYDTVVVFDKVRENTAGLAGGSRMTYSQAANLAVNQTLVRSINTSVVALLPVAAILVVGVGVLGAGTLEDLALALFIGIAAGAYSSIFIATPIAVDLKEREPAMKALTKRVEARQSGVEKKSKQRSRTVASPADAAELIDEEELAAEKAAGITDGGAKSAPSSKSAPSNGSGRTQPRRQGSKSSKSKRRPGGKRR